MESRLSEIANVIKAIHDTDLERVLKKLGLYEKLVKGKLRCAICGRSLSLENLGGLYKEGGEVKLVCNRIGCLTEAARRISLARLSTRKFGYTL